MGFLSPWFLAGLAAVGLPVWLHLLKKHKSTPLPFSSLMFFEKRTQSSVKHRRLQYLLLFALRTALVILVALTFASPFLMRKPAAAGGSAALKILAIDDSFSMRQGDRFARARREAAAVVAKLRPGEEAMVIAFAGQAKVVSERTNDPAALRAAVGTMEPSDSRASYGDLARALRSIAESSNLPLEVHLVSDMQKSALPPGFADLQLPGGSSLVPHPVASGPLANWAVESVTAPRRLAEKGAASVRATIVGFATEKADLRASLVVNGTTLETKTVEVPASGRAAVEFLSLEAPYGLSRGEVRLDSSDQFPADNRFLFPVERAKAQPVLFVHEARDARSPLYFRAALEAGGAGAFSLDAKTVQQVSGLDPSSCVLTVLSNVGALPRDFEEALARHVRGGGSLLVALGPAASVRGKAPLLDAPILESRYATRRGERFQSVAWIDPAHAALRGAGRWDGVKFYRSVRIDSGDARVLARFADETPLLFEGRAGAGRVLVFASTFDNISNDFPLHASFVPFVQQATRYLGGLEDHPGALVVDAFLQLRQALGGGSSVQVIDPEGRRALNLAQVSSAEGVALRQEGFYEVRRDDGRNELVAANADRRESDLTLIPEETLSLWQNTGEGATTASGGAGVQPERWGLWWYGMLAVLALALAESFFGSRYLSGRKEAA